MKILVTGGAGFIGSGIVHGLLDRGHDVVVLDNLDPQVHPNKSIESLKSFEGKSVEFIHGDVTRPSNVVHALDGVEVVYHEAAAVGVGQSMYEIVHYTKNNTMGAAVLLEEIINRKDQIKRMVVASSMSIYGEGEYYCHGCGEHSHVTLRSDEQMKRCEWEHQCPKCGFELTSMPTTESKPINPTSIYAINKRDHEEMFLAVGKAYDIPTIAFRYFNVYGAGQSLSNPYTGVAAIFSSQLLNGNSPMVYEDGLQTRDFVHVSDVVQANMLALIYMDMSGIFNVGSGNAVSIKDVAQSISNELGKDIQPNILDKFRSGDVRHCVASIDKIRYTMGYEPKVQFRDGIKMLVDWVKHQNAIDNTDRANKELRDRNLIF